MNSTNTFRCPVSGCSQSYESSTALQCDSFDQYSHNFAAADGAFVTSISTDDDAFASADSTAGKSRAVSCDIRGEGQLLSPKQPDVEMEQIEVQKHIFIPSAPCIDGADDVLLDWSPASGRSTIVNMEACGARTLEAFFIELEDLISHVRPTLGALLADYPEVAGRGSMPQQSAQCPQCN